MTGFHFRYRPVLRICSILFATVLALCSWIFLEVVSSFPFGKSIMSYFSPETLPYFKLRMGCGIVALLVNILLTPDSNGNANSGPGRRLGWSETIPEDRKCPYFFSLRLFHDFDICQFACFRMVYSITIHINI